MKKRTVAIRKKNLIAEKVEAEKNWKATDLDKDPAIRGRVMGIYLLIFMGGTPVYLIFDGAQLGPACSAYHGETQFPQKMKQHPS